MSRTPGVLLFTIALGALGGFGATVAVGTPTITATCSPGPSNCARWYGSNVSLKFTVSADAVSTAGCDATLFIAEGSYERFCTAEDINGNGASRRVFIGIDHTAPLVTGALPSRSPNATGWINGPFDVQFTGTDATSGLAACTATYAGPTTSSGSLTRTCADQAGNVSAPFTFSFKYDATPPTLSAVTTAPGDGLVRVNWRAPDAVSVEVARSPGLAGAPLSAVFRGTASAFVDRHVRNLAAYRYQVTAVDRAGNLTTKTVGASPARRLLAPANGARLTRPPLARWALIPRATYYNVQLYRGDRKILSLWPKTAALKLRGTWMFQGVRYRLAPGVYRLFVWPGFGTFAQQRYGRIVGKSRFVVTK